MATMFPLAEPARTRIIRLTNVHFSADKAVIEKFFADYTIEDQMRTINSRTGHKSIVYVLFASVADRLRACKKTDRNILDRIIKIQPAPTGNYKLNKDEIAFIPTNDVDTSKAADRPTEAAYEYNNADFPTFGQGKETKAPQLALATPVEALEVIEEPNVAAEPGITATLNAVALEPSHQASVEDAVDEEVKADAEAPDAETNLEDVGIQGVGADATPSPIEERFLTYDIDMTIPPRHENWNLAGHNSDDPAHNVITEAQWYRFEDEQMAKFRQDLEKYSNVRRILDEAGRYEE
ncbi:hypothetical protein CC86DRAFT_383348 [Ophiobolus disseminans]|uniref:RRM domain-containing protein n=1 Tax=Ophiobolus disseminans TaxID=1469910 RepID=A0A6A6ZY87_9PLEO|nr:hypothetical protein CC86DRAFT_383348 [Ophiobolus disseminans]